MSIHYNPTERTAKKAAEIWKGLLRAPKYDNGDHGPTGAMTQFLVSKLKSNATEEILEVFGEELVKLILTPSDTSPDYYPNSRLHVDYDPCKPLRTAAEIAGLKMEFPWKTNMNIHADFVSVAAGYGSDWVNHYALDNGKWLVTTITASHTELEMIKAHVMAGAPLTFKVED